MVVPNLPHFRVNRPRRRGRGGDFNFDGGTHFFEQVCSGTESQPSFVNIPIESFQLLHSRGSQIMEIVACRVSLVVHMLCLSRGLGRRDVFAPPPSVIEPHSCKRA